MKRIIKRFSLFVSIVLTFLFPLNIYALTEQTSYVSVNDVKSLQVGSLSFSSLNFKDNSYTSTQSFGLSGNLINSSANNINYVATISYYDSNYQLVAQATRSEDAIPGKSNFNLISSLSILKGHSVSDVSFYNLSVKTINNNINSTNKISTPSKSNQYRSYDYVIDKYDVNIIVNENNTFDITETITAYFNISKHGIFRTIPLKNSITRLDGTTSNNRAQITNLTVDNEYKKSIEDRQYKIKIGSSNRTLTGEQKYIIKYTYNLGKDPLKSSDELYYNIIGNEWDTVIGNITFTIKMPKDFDSSQLGFSSGIMGSIDNSNIKYSVIENTITGSYDGILVVGEALTVRCELPEGYFVGARYNYSLMTYMMFLIPILSLGIIIFLWYKFGRDDQVIETVEFYPPEGLNSLEVGFLYRGKAKKQDVTSLLIYLANKGYIQIVDKTIDLDSKKLSINDNSRNRADEKIIDLQNKINEEKMKNPNSKKIKYYENMLGIYQNIDKPIDYKKYGVSSSIKKSNSKDKFIIKKLKDYDGQNIYEQWFMEGLFESEATEVTSKMLRNKFYITNNQILKDINNGKNKIFEKNTANKTVIVVLLMIISLILTISVPTLAYGDMSSLFVTLLLCAFYIPFYAMGISSKNIIVLLFIIVHSCFMFSAFPIGKAITSEPIYLCGFIVGLLCLVGMTVCLKLMPKRTQYGNEILGKLRGFKNFLETVEKDKLEAMVIDNPSYFYDILPYTYVLGVSDKWIKKFESISVQSPDWYDSTTTFDVASFGIFMNTTMTSAQSSMSSSPSSSSSSGSSSSGGGSSGGGSGGGGGGSW